MPVSLAQASQNTTDDLDLQVIDEFRKSSWLLDRLTFDDVVNPAGGRPANFLDIGGGASAQVMADGLHIILSDPQVKSVFVNVFGGITSCDSVAAGIIQAFGLLADLGETPDKPLVVRLDGNNAEVGRTILMEAEHDLIEMVDTMDDAARRVAQLAAQGA